MKKKSKNRIEDCADCQQKLIGIIAEKSALTDFPLLGRHINECAECQSLLDILTRIEKQSETEMEGLPNPRRAILPNTIKYMAMKYSDGARHESLWNTISGIMTYRIPVYQAVGGVLTLMLLSSFLWSSYYPSGHSGVKTASSKILNQDLNLSDTLLTMQTERGQNAHEDSILVGFLQSSL